MYGIETWEGIFESAQYGKKWVSGTIIINLPCDLRGPYSSKAIICYKGIYKSNATVAVLFNMEESFCNGYIYTFTITGEIVGCFFTQNLIFHATYVNINDGIAQGTYKSQNPSDIGTFEIRRTIGDFVQDLEQDEGTCNIC